MLVEKVKDNLYYFKLVNKFMQCNILVNISFLNLIKKLRVLKRDKVTTK